MSLQSVMELRQNVRKYQMKCLDVPLTTPYIFKDLIALISDSNSTMMGIIVVRLFLFLNFFTT